MNDNEFKKEFWRTVRSDLRLLAHYLLSPIVLALRLSCIGLSKAANWLNKV